MKGGTVQILWHGSDPILSVDFHMLTGLLATAGADRDIKLWSLHRPENSKAIPSATFKGNLSYHNAAVNVLRFSPTGELLASGADNGELVIWRITQSDEEVPVWKVWKILRSHHKDVLDLDWSSDGAYLVSGSVDNTCVIWNVMKGDVEQVLADHLHYVQGVTWDPAGKYFASLSGDRTCRIYSMQSTGKKSKAKDKNLRKMFKSDQVLVKADTPVQGTASTSASPGVGPVEVPSSRQYLFYDENMPSFFRRLSWSPDGSFLLIPSGFEKQSSEAPPCSVSYIVSRTDLSRPVLLLPAGNKAVVATRFCPVIFSLSPKKIWKHDTDAPGIGVFNLPYRIIFAVATLNSVFIYDTEQSCPIAVFAGLHFAPITDLAWSFDAKFLAVSSQDGYCTLVGFDEGDLGTPLPRKDLPPHVVQNVDPLVPEVTPRGMDHSTELDEVPIVGSEEALQKGCDSPVISITVRRVSPIPIPENPHHGSSSRCDVRKLNLDSGCLDFREHPLPDARCGQNTAEPPLEMSEPPGGSSGGERGEFDRIEDSKMGQALSVLSTRESNEGSTSSQAVGKETSATLQSRPATVNARSSINAKSHCRLEVSQEFRQSVAGASGSPSTAVCQEHVSASSMGICQKPRDPSSDLYVRPLKFRRITPNVISENLDDIVPLKPLRNDASLTLSSV